MSASTLAEVPMPAESGVVLGKRANSAATAGQSADDRMREAWVTRRRLRKITTVSRVRKCGRSSVLEGGGVEFVYEKTGDEASAGIRGIASCGSLWVCPRCSTKIGAERAKELDDAIRWNHARGGSVALLTLTMQHTREHRLADLRAGLTGAWRHVTSSRGWKEAKRTLGMDYVRAIECTDGAHGWHLHAHVLLLFDARVEEMEVHRLRAQLVQRWRDGLARGGFSASNEHGVDLRFAEQAHERMGRYLSKIAFEAAGGRWKKGRAGRTPWELLAGALDGEERDRARWFEWEDASHGMRQLVWSRGLKAKIGIDDKTDEEIAEKALDAPTVAYLDAASWARAEPRAEEYIITLRREGPEALRASLDANQVQWSPQRPPEVADVYRHQVLPDGTEEVRPVFRWIESDPDKPFAGLADRSREERAAEAARRAADPGRWWRALQGAPSPRDQVLRTFGLH